VLTFLAGDRRESSGACPAVPPGVARMVPPA